MNKPTFVNQKKNPLTRYDDVTTSLIKSRVKKHKLTKLVTHVHCSIAETNSPFSLFSFFGIHFYTSSAEMGHTLEILLFFLCFFRCFFLIAFYFRTSDMEKRTEKIVWINLAQFRNCHSKHIYMDSVIFFQMIFHIHTLRARACWVCFEMFMK